MRHEKSLLLLFFKKEVLALIFSFLSFAAAAEDPVVAERGADHFTLTQARNLLAGIDAETRRKLQADPHAMSDLLRNVLLQRAILAQAGTEHWDQRADVAALLQRSHDQLLAQNYLTAHAPIPAAYPSEADLQAAYEQNKSKFLQPRSYHLAQVFFAKPPGAASDTLKRLVVLRAQITRARLSFEAAAKQTPGLQYSDLGWVSDMQLVPAVKGAVSGLLEGGVSDPVCTDTGCHLIRLIATRPAGFAPLADVRDGLIRALRQQKQADAERAYASGLLQKQAVNINEIELSHLAR
jgi:parvulin-like peptidyl-prolyl isomerase